MIKQIKNLMLVAVAAMGFVACSDNIEEATRPVETKMVDMTITAGMEDTRTVIDEANKVVNWSADDELKVIENSATYRTTSAITIDGEGKAKFAVSFPANTTATAFTYNAIYPASAVHEDDAEKINNTKIKVEVKEAQKPTATSFDPAADILVSKHIETESQPTELNMQFKRLVALGKMTLNNLPASSTISQVVFKAGSTDALAGRNYVDATTGKVSQYCYYGKTNTITLSYNEPIATRDIYFTCNPFEMEAGEVFTVKVICDDATYTREITIPDGRSLTFAEGDLNTFTVDMTNATKETNFTFADGDYAVLAVKSGKYYALTCDADGTRLDAIQEYPYDGSGSIMLDDKTAKMRWTITNTEQGYTFKGVNNGYIAWYNNGNYARTQTEPYYLNIIEDEKNAGRYNVVAKADETRKLQHNNDPTQYTYFAFYTSSQMGSLLLVPIAENTAPHFTISQDADGYIADGGEIEFEVIYYNGFNAEVTASTDAEWISFDHNGTIIYATAEPNEGAARSATITFSAEGYKSVEVTVKQDGAENSGPTPITVKEFLDLKDTTNEYILTGKITSVANTSYGNFNLTDGTGTVYVYGLLTPDGVAQKQWATAGLKEGDVITIKGIYSLYNNSPQVKNAVYVSHYGLTLDKTNVSFEAEGGTQSVNVTLINTTEAIEITNSNSHFQVTNNGNVITIVAPENETEDVLSSTINVKVGMSEGTITIAQATNSSSGEAAWTLVTDINTLAVGDQIVIVASKSNYALSTNQKTNNRGQASVTKLNNTVTFGSDVQIITLEAGKVDGTFAFNVGSTGYLYAASSSSNHLRTEKTLSNNSSWKIEISSTGVATVKAQGTNTRNWMRYNSQSSLFACYSSGQNDISIYKLM